MSTYAGFKLQHPTQHVLLALAPGALLSAALSGWGVLAHLALTIGLCILVDLLERKISRQSLQPSADMATLLSGALIALSLPASAPWWMGPLGAVIGLSLSRYLLPTLSIPSLNAAMLGVAGLLILCPAQMSNGNNVSIVDALSSATSLDIVRDGLRQQSTFSEISARLPTTQIWISLAYLLGGLYLLWRGIVRWTIPVAVIVGLTLPALLLWVIDADRHASPLFHVLSGATVLSAFFIATEPSNAPTFQRERLIYGASIGLLAYAIRTWGRYPDGFAFAVLLMNLTFGLLQRPAYRMRRAVIASAIGLALSLLLITPYQQSWGRLQHSARASALQEILSAATHDNQPVMDTIQINDPQLAAQQSVTVYRARNSGAVVAMVFDVVTTEGYNGEIELLVGVRADGTVMGVRAIRHQETGGLGDKIDTGISSWMLGFNGRSLDQPSSNQWRLKNDGGAFDQFSGASITPRAVVASVKRTLEYFSQHRNELLSAP